MQERRRLLLRFWERRENILVEKNRQAIGYRRKKRPRELVAQYGQMSASSYTLDGKLTSYGQDKLGYLVFRLSEQPHITGNEVIRMNSNASTLFAPQACRERIMVTSVRSVLNMPPNIIGHMTSIDSCYVLFLSPVH